jgi:hypothetical protein
MARSDFCAGRGFVRAQEAELQYARAKHPRINSLHEGYGVIVEEMYKLWQEIVKDAPARDPVRVHNKLVSVAAMAQRTAEDLGYAASCEQAAR